MLMILLCVGRNFFVEGWNSTESSHEHHVKTNATFNTSITLTTADASFTAFLGKGRLSFFSNDTRVLGLKERPMRRDHDEAAVRQDTYTHSNYLSMGILNWNFDTSTRSAVQKSIRALDTTSGKITCEECYLYVGEIL
jgi:hypothetical protein